MALLLFASNNPGKFQEVKELLRGLPVEIVTPDVLGLQLSIQEVGNSYRENAELKAAEYSGVTGLLTLADDSGLEVEALGGLPGVRSRRFLPKQGASDAERRLYLLARLHASPRPWLARFKCVFAFATVDDQMYFTEGECRGEIVPNERGTKGFGYDPIFLISELKRTMAELSTREKNRLSHRALAAKKMIPILEGFISQTSRK